MAQLVFFIGILRSLVEVAGFCLLGQGVLLLLAGRHCQTNPIYRGFQLVTSPATRLVAGLMPRSLSGRRLAQVTFCILFGLWILLAYARLALCQGNGLACGS